jgi:ABC-type amino acid transport substrate-binding protein
MASLVRYDELPNIKSFHIEEVVSLYIWRQSKLMKRKRHFLCSAFSWFFQWATILAVVLLVLAAVSVSDAEDKDDALIISIDRAYAPLTFVNSFGRPSGLLVDLWRTWAKETVRQITFRVSSWSETLEGLKNGDVDIHSGLSFSKEREEWIGFSNQIHETFTRIYHRAGDPQPAGIGGYGTDGVGVMFNSYQESKFRSEFPTLAS